ncbi:MAG: glycoside hydrolase family 9 protein [Isosphaeraceae bacterium]
MSYRSLILLAWLPLVVPISSSSASEPPRVEHVGLVAPDIMGVTIVAGHVEYGRQVPYAKQTGDFVIPFMGVQRFVLRKGKVIGSLVGRAGDTLCTMDEVTGDRFDTSWADRPASYRIQSRDDARFVEPRQPTAVYRKSKPSDLAMVGAMKFDYPTENVVYLRLPVALATGKTYELSFPGSALSAVSLTTDPSKPRSEAVHVSQIGFRPDDPVKIAFLSCWMGNGGGLSYQAGLPFSVINDATCEVVFRGRTILSKAATEKNEDGYGKNYNGSDVYQMDFSTLSKPGRYRVCVDDLGCSYPFEIAPDVWRKAFIVSARGFYHQRSGVALGPPYSDFHRRRPFHPDDGVKVYASKTPLIDTGNGLNQKDTNFGNLVKGKTDEIVPNAWGGYMDAGDWDRRIHHLKVSRLLLDLAELFPEYFAQLALNIPESGNGLPDIVDEALFNIDCYRRLQTPEGGVRGGIESSEHPRRGEASFQESLDVMAYAPDAFSSYIYAGAAARAAHWLAARDPRKAGIYRESALRAMNWAEKDLPREEKEFLMGKHPAVRDARNDAAAEMFRLTGEARWNDLFVATTEFTKPYAPVPYRWDSLDQADAAWVYVRTDRPGMGESVKRNCRSILIREADGRAASVDRTAFHWAKHLYRPVVMGALSSPDDAVCVVRAHVLTRDPKYLRALVLACQTGAGANPVNMCYTTGMGQKSPRHPLEIDHRITRQAPPPGLTVGGPMDNTMAELKGPFIGPFAGASIFPPKEKWPALEAYWDVFWDPMLCEYTVQRPMAGNAYVWGYLAACAR